MQTILNPSDERLREIIAEKDREIARLKQDAERYRKLKGHLKGGGWTEFNSTVKWTLEIKDARPGQTLDSIIDALPEVQS